MKCSRCNLESDTLITVVNQKTNKAEYLCEYCMASLSEKFTDIEEVDKNISMVEEVIRLGSKFVEQDLDPDLSDFGEAADLMFTPSKTIKMAEAMLKTLKFNRQDILDNMPEMERLTYELNQAVKNKDFSLASSLRDKIKKLKEDTNS